MLRDGGKLDPKKPKDRAANEAYFDAVVAPANPDAATLVGYVRRTAMMPTKLGQRIRGGLASDDPQHVVNAASLIQELGKSDDALAKGFGAKRRRFAHAVMDGIDVVGCAGRSGTPDRQPYQVPKGQARWLPLFQWRAVARGRSSP